MYRLAQLVSPRNLPQPNTTSVSDVLTILFTAIGALAFLMLIIAGFRYVISAGEPQKVAEIRRQIIYTVIGLVLAASADIVVHFVVGRT